MNKSLSLLCGLSMILFVWLPAYSQSSTKKMDYKVVFDDILIESGRKVLIANYAFQGSTIKTRETYFSERDEQAEGLVAATKSYSGCGPQIDITDKTGKEMGRKIACEDKPSKVYVIAFSHFDSLNKVNVISGASPDSVERFVKGICPYAYDLYADIDCPDSE